jgi:hypothetical protein
MAHLTLDVIWGEARPASKGRKAVAKMFQGNLQLGPELLKVGAIGSAEPNCWMLARGESQQLEERGTTSKYLPQLLGHFVAAGLV